MIRILHFGIQDRIAFRRGQRDKRTAEEAKAAIYASRKGGYFKSFDMSGLSLA